MYRIKQTGYENLSDSSHISLNSALITLTKEKRKERNTKRKKKESKGKNRQKTRWRKGQTPARLCSRIIQRKFNFFPRHLSFLHACSLSLSCFLSHSLFFFLSLSPLLFSNYTALAWNYNTCRKLHAEKGRALNKAKKKREEEKQNKKRKKRRNNRTAFYMKSLPLSHCWKLHH